MGDPVDVPLRWFVEQGDTAVLWSPADLSLADGTVLHDVTALPPDLPWGWHTLQPRDGGPVTELVVHPAQCPPTQRRSGVAVQVHELWSDGTWETGDLTDVRRLLERLARAGGDTALLSPLHALLPGALQDPSPYSPSSRLWRHALLARPTGIPPVDLVPDPRRLVERFRAWEPAQRALDDQFDRLEPGGSEDMAWRTWVGAQGQSLKRFSRWCVAAERYGVTWRAWPRGLRHPDGDGWATWFTADGDAAHRADRHAWAQWRVAQALTDCAATGVGVITDLAVGFHPDGFDAWAFQDVVAQGVSIGAPPDPLGPNGQNWGLPPLLPGALAAQRFEPWLVSLRSAAHAAAGVRLDHVMGLFRQFWIPGGGTAADGAYVRFPGEQWMAALVMEACRAGVFVIGEDLGTVEPEVRALMHRRRVLGTRVAWFEPEVSPRTWPVESLATLTTHDLPTLAGMWASTRADDREQRDRLANLAGVAPDDDVAARTVIDAAHRELLQAPSQVRLLTVDDLCASELRPNLPGVVGPPSWCVRLPVPVAAIPLDVFDHGAVTM
jgi:4-alpha-glucanotransferase